MPNGINRWSPGIVARERRVDNDKGADVLSMLMGRKTRGVRFMFLSSVHPVKTVAAV